jgi:RecA-family ATPase
MKNSSFSPSDTTDNHFELRKFQSAIEYAVDGRPIFDVDSREDYIQVLMAAHSADPSPDGCFCHAARDWAKKGRTYNDRDFTKDWSSFRDRPNGITLGTIFYRAREAGWTPPYEQNDDGAERVQRFWGNLSIEGESAYFKAKGLPTPNNVRFGRGFTALSYFGIDGNLRGIVTIPDDDFKLKKWVKGSQPKGSFFSSEYPDDFGFVTEFYISEGAASALAIEHAFRTADPAGCETAPNELGVRFPTKAVLSAGSCQNLKHVAWAVRQRYPAAAIIICGDDEGLDGDAGRKFAERAAREVPGCKLVFPRFQSGPNSKERSDFCDLLSLEGVEAVVEQIRKAAYPVPEVEATEWKLDEFRCDVFLDAEPPPRRYLVRDLIPANVVGALLGAGGSRKSTLLLQLAAAKASGRSWADGLGDIEKPGAVLSLVLEDDRAELHRRLRMIIGEMSGQDPETEAEIKALLRRNLFIRSLVGENNSLVEKRGGRAEITSRVRQIIDLAEQIEGLDLIIIEPVSRIFAADENNASDMSRLVEALEQIREATGATVLVAHHINKAALRERESSQAVSRGSSALVDGSRWTALIRTAQKGEIRHTDHTRWAVLDLVKANYVRLQTDLWMYAEPSGFLRRADPTKASADALLGQIKRMIEQDAAAGKLWTMSGFVRKYGGAEGPFGVGRDKLMSGVQAGIEKQWFLLEDRAEAASRFPKAAEGRRNDKLLVPSELENVIEFPKRGGT